MSSEFAVTTLKAVAAAGRTWTANDVFTWGRTHTGSAEAYAAMRFLVNRGWLTYSFDTKEWTLTEKGAVRARRKERRRG